MQQFGMNKSRTPGYRPQANGLTEQSNSTIKNYLRKYLNSKGSKQPDWDLWLRELCNAYNTSIHSSTGYSPAELMFGGRKFIISLDILYGSTHASHYSFESFKAELKLMYDIARSQMGLRQAKAATYVDKMINTELQRDDSGLIFDPRSKQDKLGLHWKGPYQVVNCAHPCYEVSTPSGNKWLPRDRLRQVPKDFGHIEEEEEVTHETASTDDDEDDADSEKDERAKNGEEGRKERQSPHYDLRPRPRGRIPFY